MEQISQETPIGQTTPESNHKKIKTWAYVLGAVAIVVIIIVAIFGKTVFYKGVVVPQGLPANPEATLPHTTQPLPTVDVETPSPTTQSPTVSTGKTSPSTIVLPVITPTAPVTETITPSGEQTSSIAGSTPTASTPTSIAAGSPVSKTPTSAGGATSSVPTTTIAAGDLSTIPKTTTTTPNTIFTTVPPSTTTSTSGTNTPPSIPERVNSCSDYHKKIDCDLDQNCTWDSILNQCTSSKQTEQKPEDELIAANTDKDAAGDTAVASELQIQCDKFKGYFYDKTCTLNNIRTYPSVAEMQAGYDAYNTCSQTEGHWDTSIQECITNNNNAQQNGQQDRTQIPAMRDFCEKIPGTWVDDQTTFYCEVAKIRYYDYDSLTAAFTHPDDNTAKTGDTKDDTAAGGDKETKIITSSSESTSDNSKAEIDRLQAEIARLNQQLANSQNSQNNAALIDRINQLDSQLSRLLAQSPAPIVINMPASSGGSPGSPPIACSDPTFRYDATRRVCVPPNEIVVRASATSADNNEGGTGRLITTAEDDERTNLREQSSALAGDSADSNIPQDEIAAVVEGETPTGAGRNASAGTRINGAASGSGARAFGTVVQGETGPEALLYPILISAANGLWFLARRKKRKV